MKDYFYEEWASCIQFLKESADVPQLIITLDDSLDTGNRGCYRITTDDLPIEKMVELLKNIGGFGDCFVFLSHPFWGSQSQEVTLAQERVMEEQVMGKGYDSVGRGKFNGERRCERSYF